MGDLGRLDAQGRVWFCGRKSHRIETRDGMLAPVPLENIFNNGYLGVPFFFVLSGFILTYVYHGRLSGEGALRRARPTDQINTRRL